MSLGLRAYHTAGQFCPRYEFNAKSGRWTKVDRSADGRDIIRIDITMARPMFAWDIGSIEVGWVNFQTGNSPTFSMVPFGQPMPERPDRNHKAGFRSKIMDSPGAAPREFSSTAGVTVDAIEALWDRLAVMPEAAAGQVPVIQAVNVDAVHGARGTNYSPVFDLLQWIARDEAAFGPRTVAAPGAPPIALVVATPAAAAWTASPAMPTPVLPTPAAWSTPSQKAA